MGKALAQGGYRDRVFLMTKIDGRTKAEAGSAATRNPHGISPRPTAVNRVLKTRGDRDRTRNRRVREGAGSFSAPC